ncbi:hypothetical protein [Pararhizobium sp. PWRC1-1]|uniref:hypothetical protein n=1 Tax=Pararhizobium sp. PWRC1-1 TaxID=2804566 RepID=UPI003CF47403
MTVALDKSALFDAMEAFWNAEPGNDKGVEAAISAYLTRMRLSGLHETVMAENERMKARVFAVAAE